MFNRDDLLVKNMQFPSYQDSKLKINLPESPRAKATTTKKIEDNQAVNKTSSYADSFSERKAISQRYRSVTLLPKVAFLILFFYRVSQSSDKLSHGSKHSESLASTNPFEDDDYDEEKNPFRDEEELDETNPFRADYSHDKNLNPFE